MWTSVRSHNVLIKHCCSLWIALVERVRASSDRFQSAFRWSFTDPWTFLERLPNVLIGQTVRPRIVLSSNFKEMLTFCWPLLYSSDKTICQPVYMHLDNIRTFWCFSCSRQYIVIMSNQKHDNSDFSSTLLVMPWLCPTEQQEKHFGESCP